MTRGIILGGGHGTRLKPLTDHTPKSLIEIHGEPILGYLASYMLHAGVSEISCISDMQKPVRTWLEKHKPYIRIVDQDSPIGTGQAVHLAMQDLSPKQGHGLLVMLGDIIPISLFMAGMIRDNPSISMLGARWSDEPEMGAVVETSQKMWMTDVVEKPDNPKSHRILSGIFYFADSMEFFETQQTLLNHNVRTHNRMKPKAGEFDIIGTIKLMYQLGTSFKVIDGGCLSVGTFEEIDEAEAYFANNANR